MKKTLLLMFALLGAMMAQAQNTVTYTDDLVVTINEESTDPQKTEIKITTNEDGTYKFILDNFILSVWDEEEQEYSVMPVGSIVLDNVTGKEENGRVYLNVDQTIEIQPGTDESVAPEEWLGLMLNAIGGVPIVMSAEFTADKLYCLIDIDMREALKQIIKVSFGTPFAEEDCGTVSYIDDLVVTINEESTDPQKTEIKITTNEDGTYKFILDNFILSVWDEEEQEYSVMPVGSIVLDNVAGKEENGRVYLNVDQTIEIQPGTDESVAPEEWLGLMLNAIGGVPIVMSAEFTADKLYCLIDIDMREALKQIIKVSFGSPFDETGFHSVAVVQKNIGQYYSLDGILMGEDWNTLSKGIYVKDGKKVIKK